MKKRLSILLAIILATTMLTACGSKQKTGIEGIKERGKMVVGLDDSFPPMGFRDDNNEIVGFDIDLANEVGKILGVEVELKPVVWETVAMSLNNGDIDMIWNGYTISEARKKEVLFSEPYLTNQQIIVVGPDSDIEGKADLAGKTVALQAGSTSQDALEKDVEVFESIEDVRKFENNVDALLDLKVGRVDAVIVDSVVGRYYTSLHPEDYFVVDDSFMDEFYGIGMRKEDKSFADAINQALEELRENGTAGEISKKWFSEDVFID
ncbi:MAG: amino acid ABC transporter substrate-binding protein [Epulopiscium sp.]|nr:amino acid ABC transporter substrate-binding protein [Candidatus Epulonipiscium sp.]